MNQIKKVLFIINKYSGTGYRPDVEGRIVDTCISHDAECTLEFTKDRGHAIELARQGVGQFDVIAAVGGDGTINEVAQGLVHQNTIMGIIPRGSGNGLARHLGIPLDIAGAVNTLFEGSSIKMDTFTINGRRSLNVSGIGFDGHVANHFGKNGKRGLVNYTRLTLAEYARFQEFEADLVIDDSAFSTRNFIIAIANSSQYGNNARIAPYASVCDAKLNVCLINKVPPYRIDFISLLFRGRIHETAFCQIREAGTLTVRANQAIPYHVDGEPCGTEKSFEVSIDSASLRVAVPATKKRI